MTFGTARTTAPNSCLWFPANATAAATGTTVAYVSALPQLLTQNHLLGGVPPMKLEKIFVHANSAYPFHGRSPLFEIRNDLILAQSMPSGAVRPNIHS
jgi:hypothetical protein